MPRVAVGLFAAAVTAAIVCGRTGAGFMTGFEQPEPALAKVPPELPLDPASGPRFTQRVILAIVDGLSLESSRGLPALDSLRARGVDGRALSHYPTWSRPNYVSILTGVPPTESGIRTNHHPWTIPLDSIMTRVRAAGLHVAVVSDRAMIPPLFVTKPGATGALDAVELRFDGDHTFPPDGYTWPFDDARYSRDDIGRVAADLVGGSAELVIILTGVVDAAGHASGRDSDAYRQAARDADAMLGHVLAKVDLSRDTVIVTADHGHSARGGHGGLERDVLDVPLVLAGAGVNAGQPLDTARLIDISPTIAGLLGVPSPGHALGWALTNVTKVPSTRFTIDQNRMVRLHTTVIDPAVEADEIVTHQHRAIRLAALVVGTLAAVALGVRARRRGSIVVRRRTLIIGVVPIIASFGAALFVVAGSLSPSSIPTRGDIVVRAVSFAITMVAVQLATTAWLLRGRAGRLPEACGLAWIGLVVVAVAGGCAWMAYPPPYTTMPEPIVLVVVPTIELAAACGATAIAFVMVVELVLSRRLTRR